MRRFAFAAWVLAGCAPSVPKTIPYVFTVRGADTARLCVDGREIVSGKPIELPRLATGQARKLTVTTLTPDGWEEGHANPAKTASVDSVLELAEWTAYRKRKDPRPFRIEIDVDVHPPFEAVSFGFWVHDDEMSYREVRVGPYSGTVTRGTGKLSRLQGARVVLGRRLGNARVALDGIDLGPYAPGAGVLLVDPKARHRYRLYSVDYTTHGMGEGPRFERMFEPAILHRLSVVPDYVFESPPQTRTGSVEGVRVYVLEVVK